MTDLTITRIARIELTFAPDTWSFARRHRAEIGAHFAKRRNENPALWNGQVLLLRDPIILDDVFRGVCFPVDYASFLAWRDWGFPDNSAKINVPQGALRSSDGAFLLGVMAGHTARPGSIHFPAGMPDLSDVVDGFVSLHDSMLREIVEETGLSSDDLFPGSHWYTIYGGPWISHFKVLQSSDDAHSLRKRILAHLACDPQSELIDIRIVRGIADLAPELVATTAAFLKFVWR